MTGLQKIIDGILEEANRAADEIIKSAEEEAQRTVSEAQRKAEEYRKAGEEAAESNRAKFQKQLKSAVEAKERTVRLTEKQAVLEASLKTAYDALLAMPLAEYTVYLEKLILSHLRPGEGTVYFSQKDLERLPKEFLEDVIQTAKENGCTLSISKEPKGMDGGCLLSFGGIEENCSFEALFSAHQNRLLDGANTLIFGE